jgi:UDP-N-acetylglucosamine 2-epimerase (non-hydrolysing)
MTFAVIAGTRPEIIKQYPVMRLLDLEDIDYKFIYTGQHYDYELSDKFIEEFKIREPDYYIKLPNPADPVRQVSEIISNVGKILQELKPSLVVVQGDTNSVLASALAAVKSSIRIAHIEAGLRSYNWKMYEEHNRRIVDHISDILFAPTEESANNLRNEQVHGDIYVTGNTVIDAVNLYFQAHSTRQSNKKNGQSIDEGLSSLLPSSSVLNSVLQKFKSKRNSAASSTQDVANNTDNKEPTYNFVLVTLHRSENVDNRHFLKEALTAMSASGFGYIFPMHPHTLKRLHEFGLENFITKNISVIEPVGYSDFLMLLKMCRFVITDSGGVQEEITSPLINKHAIILRDSTERPESVQSGHSILCRANMQEIFKAIKNFDTGYPKPENTCPYGSGNSAEKIVEILKKSYAKEKLSRL